MQKTPYQNKLCMLGALAYELHGRDELQSKNNENDTDISVTDKER